MKNVVATLTLATIDLPDGVDAGLFQFTLSAAGTPDVVQQTDQTTATFANLAAGDYTVTALRLSTANAPLADAVTATVTVPPPVQADVPASVAVSLG